MSAQPTRVVLGRIPQETQVKNRHNELPSSLYRNRLFLYFFILGFLQICSYLFLLVLPAFFSALCLAHPSILFYSSSYSLFWQFLSSVFYSLYFLFSLVFLCYPFFSIFILLYSSKPIVQVLYGSLSCLSGCHTR